MTGNGARPPRLSDVARLAGVSAQTVSNVLNGRRGFGEETRRRVLAAAEELQFRPNRAARQLRTRRSRQLGLHVPESDFSVQNPFTISFLRAVIRAVEQRQHQLVVFTHAVDDHSVREGLLSAGVDGFLLSNIDPGDPRPHLLAEAGIPFVVFGRPEPGVPAAWVDIDNVAAIGELVDHLVAKGYRRFGYVGYDAPQYWNAERLRGVRERLAHHGCKLPERWVVVGDYEHVRATVPKRLLGARRPEVVVCASDSLAAQVHWVASRAGLRPGTDIAVTGFDGVPTAYELDPPLTTVALPVDAAAEAVVDLLLTRIEGAPVPEEGLILPTRVVVGGSA